MTELDPVQLLQHPIVDLVGEWDSIKWEYWLRERELTPAVRNLAQHGVLFGTIGGQMVFNIAPEHRVLAVELFDGLHAALQAEWPATEVTLRFEVPSSMLPMQMKQARYAAATQCARELVLADTVIAPILHQLEAEIVAFELKDLA